MKEAAGEANMTVVTIILIAAIVAVATPIITSMMSTFGEKACCMDAGGYWDKTECKDSGGNKMETNTYYDSGNKKCIG